MPRSAFSEVVAVLRASVPMPRMDLAAAAPAWRVDFSVFLNDFSVFLAASFAILPACRIPSVNCFTSARSLTVTFCSAAIPTSPNHLNIIRYKSGIIPQILKHREHNPPRLRPEILPTSHTIHRSLRITSLLLHLEPAGELRVAANTGVPPAFLAQLTLIKGEAHHGDTVGVSPRPRTTKQDMRGNTPFTGGLQRQQATRVFLTNEAVSYETGATPRSLRRR